MSHSPLQIALERRLRRIEERLEAACRRAGRTRADVTLVAVTKTVASAVAALLPELGVVDLGESRPQELWHKAATLPGTVRWHLIGHLQRNKIARTLPLVRFIHSVDSVRLIRALEEEAGRLAGKLPADSSRHTPCAVWEEEADRLTGKLPGPVSIFLEVNVSGEQTKGGFTPEELSGLAPQLAELAHVHVKGLMTLAAFEEAPERCRPTFTGLRQLRDRLRDEFKPPHSLEHLSMGMSNDFEVAVEEGATLVRIGTALFEGLTAMFEGLEPNAPDMPQAPPGG